MARDNGDVILFDDTLLVPRSGAGRSASHTPDGLISPSLTSPELTSCSSVTSSHYHKFTPSRVRSVIRSFRHPFVPSSVRSGTGYPVTLRIQTPPPTP